MRRTDREITDPAEIHEILRQAEYGTLSMCDGEAPYAVPMSCALYLDGGHAWLCWHGAKSGTKAEMLWRNPRVVYSCVSECRRDFAPERLHWSFFYRSAVAAGRAEYVEDPAEKNRLLQIILQHYGEHGSFHFPPAMLNSLGIWKCRIETLTGKQHLEK